MNICISKSENEIQFFKLLNSHHLRFDGRSYFESRPYKIANNIYNTCFSSISISNSTNNCILTLKGDVVDLENFEVKLSFEPKPKDDKESNEVLELLNLFLINKLSHNYLMPFIKAYSWRFYIDIFSTESLNITMIQMLSYGINELLKEAKIPFLVLTSNQFSNEERELFVIGSNWNSPSVLSENEQVHSINTSGINFLYFFGLENTYNNLLLDPAYEELSILDSYVILSINDLKEVTNLSAIRGNIDLRKIEEINNFVSSLK